MSLNVKDPEAHRLALAIAETTGETLTKAFLEALRERYDRLQRKHAKAGVAELLMIAERASRHRKGPHLDHSDLLYDENGLPK